MNQTILNEKNLKYPLRRAYQILFLKLIIRELEKAGNEEIFDGFYENLTSLLETDDGEDEFSHRHFLKDDGICISIKESNSLIRDGTTGLRLWPASLKLSEFILSNKNYFKGKSILELGSGATGFVGMTLLKSTEAHQICLSDCHDVVIRNLIENVKLNLDGHVESLETSLLVRQRLKLNNAKDLGILALPWEEIDDHRSELMSICTPHIILAADVVYDETIFDPLLRCLNSLFSSDNGEHSPEFILSQTIRNEATFHKFRELLSANSFDISTMSLDNENVKFPSETQSSRRLEDVRIMKITKC